MPSPLIDSLLQAITARPDDVPLRLHVAELLIGAGRGPEAVQQCAVVLQQDPGNARAQELMGRAFSAPVENNAPAPGVPAEEPDPEPRRAATPEPTAPAHDFDWHQAEQQFGDGPAPMFVSDEDVADEDVAGNVDDEGLEGRQIAEPEGGVIPPKDIWEVEAAGLTLADVGGMHHVKERLESSFLAPMRNPELRKLYGKSLRGGLMLYGPPGCGKTYVARAIAGEMGAGFINVTLSDVLDAYVGSSEKNLHRLFQLARRKAPVVLFIDEIDAIGHKRTQTTWSSLRNVVNQLLHEMDGVGVDNEGVFVLAATNTPWDVDPALRRPGRLDRAVCVLPPDEPARSAILQHNLSRRPVEGINLAKLARATDGFTGADLAHLCETAAELAMIDSVRSGKPRMMNMKDLTAALKQVRPSARPWFDMARNVVTYADQGGEYAELRDYMRQNKLL